MVLMMMVMPATAGFNDTAGKQAARDQQRDHGRQFCSHREAKYNVAHVRNLRPASWKGVQANAWLGGVRIECCLPKTR